MMSRKTTIKEMIEHQHAVWKPEKLIERGVQLPLNSGKISVLSGVRRCGKTALLKLTRDKLIQSGVPLTKTLFFSFDDERLILKVDELDFILQAYREVYPQQNLNECYFFFDEIQNIEHWEKFIRRIYDNESKNIFISGSNSKLLGSEIATSLRGRTLLQELFPLDFSEYLSFKGIEASFQSAQQKALLIHEFESYLKQGGFPETVDCSESRRLQILTDYYQVLLFRDIVERYQVTRIQALKYFIQKLIANLTKPFSLNKIYNEFKSQGVKTSKDNLYEILGYVEAVYLGLRVYKFDYSVVNREMSDKKIYAIDNGLLNAISYQFSENWGILLENTVSIRLRKRFSNNVFYFKQKGECDFILFDRDQPILAIQVCYDMSNSETRQRELNGLNEAMDYFNLTQGLIITMYEEETIAQLEKTIVVKSAYKWMLEAI
jgi:predicted AAA+ superfamily ATPase